VHLFCKSTGLGQRAAESGVLTMMHDFMFNNRTELIDKCRTKVSVRPARAATAEQLKVGVPMFLDQLIRTMRVEQTSELTDSKDFPSPTGRGAVSEIGTSAASHGRALFDLGFNVNQVVHDYGDLCQTITDLAHECETPFAVGEFRTLNRCLDDAIANAVTEFDYQRDYIAAEKQTSSANEQAGFFAHELRNYLNTASLAFDAALAGNLTLSGATGMLLKRSLTGLRDLIDRSINQVRENAANLDSSNIFSFQEFIAEVQQAGELAAGKMGCKFSVSNVDPELAVKGDRDLLYAALGNLLQNAFKFTHVHSEVMLRVYEADGRILVDVEDHCGGLPSGSATLLFQSFKQHSDDKSGLGLGLSIALKNVESYGGKLTVVDNPSIGCIFTIDLPRYAMPVPV